MIKIKPKLILASYPRSGNTYLRNILLDVYNIFSWNSIEKYDQAFEKIEKLEQIDQQQGLPPGRRQKLEELKQQARFSVIKTHEMPDKVLPLCDEQPVIIYLVREGRDALVSMAHHNADIVNPGADFTKSLTQSIVALRGSYFGGWSDNVKAWRDIAHRLIYFEDLIKNPLEVVESLRGLIDLPQAQTEKLPTFETQRAGKSYFGGQSRTNYSEQEKLEFNQKFFRSGKTGGWREEMPSSLQQLYWKQHGRVSLEMGYSKEGLFTGAKWKKDD